MSSIEDAIRGSAYELWDHAGGPDGRNEVEQGIDEDGLKNLLMPHSSGKVAN
jgi:hypothetical protein